MRWNSHCAYEPPKWNSSLLDIFHNWLIILVPVSRGVTDAPVLYFSWHLSWFCMTFITFHHLRFTSKCDTCRSFECQHGRRVLHPQPFTIFLFLISSVSGDQGEDPRPVGGAGAGGSFPGGGPVFRGGPDVSEGAREAAADCGRIVAAARAHHVVV